MIIDLRSDTTTKPTKGMMDAMMSAELGDDVFGEDPTVNALEAKTAALFGKEAALFCPTGTMTNQVAIKILTQPQHELICDKTAHVYNYEGAGIAFHSGVSVRTVNGDRGRISPKDVLENINPGNDNYPVTSVVSLENTCNKGGGSFYTIKQIEEIHRVTKENNLSLHLDGARIFNALTETGDQATDYGKLFDTISVCLSKGLGAPVGSVLVASKDNIKKAKRIRRVMGGGMRQAGVLAAAGIYALDHHVGRLKEDHRRAKILGGQIKQLTFLEEMLPVDSNIIVFKLNDKMKSEDFLKQLAANNIKAVPFGKQIVRMVTHLDFTDDMLDTVLKVLKTMN